MSILQCPKCKARYDTGRFRQQVGHPCPATGRHIRRFTWFTAVEPQDASEPPNGTGQPDRPERRSTGHTEASQGTLWADTA